MALAIRSGDCVADEALSMKAVAHKVVSHACVVSGPLALLDPDSGGQLASDCFSRLLASACSKKGHNVSIVAFEYNWGLV